MPPWALRHTIYSDNARASASATLVKTKCKAGATMLAAMCLPQFPIDSRHLPRRANLAWITTDLALADLMVVLLDHLLAVEALAVLADSKQPISNTIYPSKEQRGKSVTLLLFSITLPYHTSLNPNRAIRNRGKRADFRLYGTAHFIIRREFCNFGVKYFTQHIEYGKNYHK